MKAGSVVGVELTARVPALSTGREPGGSMFFSTKTDTPFNEVAWRIGDGTNLAALEEGMAGMHKGSLRRIQVPSTAIYGGRALVPVPKESDKDARRIYDRLFSGRTDATVMFEVLVTELK